MSGRTTRIGFAVALPLLLAAGTSLAGPAKAPAEKGAAPGAKAKPPAGDAPSTGKADRGGDLSGVPAIQRRLESAMQDLASMAKQAESDGDATRSACVKGWQQKGQDAMEVATGELLVIRDGNSSAQQRSFAAEKLAATAERLDTIVSQAKKCSGDQPPEDEDDETRTTVDKTETIPVQDPTLGGGNSPVPPPSDPNLPTTAASPSM